MFSFQNDLRVHDVQYTLPSIIILEINDIVNVNNRGFHLKLAGDAKNIVSFWAKHLSFPVSLSLSLSLHPFPLFIRSLLDITFHSKLR